MIHADENDKHRADRNLKAVLLTDGKWYEVEDPTIPQGPRGYLSFLQRQDDGTSVLVNVRMEDVKAAAYYGIPKPISQHRVSINNVHSMA